MTAVVATTPMRHQPSGFSDHIDDDFAVGAVRYLRRAGLDSDAIASSLVDELGIELAEAVRLASDV